MQDPEEHDLLQEVTDRSRKPLLTGNTALIPLKYDDEGDLLTPETFDVQKHLKKLTMSDLRFLQSWRKHGWNTDKACDELAVPIEKVKRLVAKLEVFREEDARTKALSEIPTPAWIQARHMENLCQGGVLEDSERDSLKELAKISGAYKTQASVNQTINIFQMPKLSPEAAQKLKEFADSQADVVETDIVA